MNPRERFIDKYKEGNTPWVHNTPDFNLIEMVENWPIHPCKVLELGCGTGVEAIWLSKQGFEVTAVDGSPIAIKEAKEALAKSNTSCDFIVSDFIDDEIAGGPYDFVFDRGFFHSFDNEIERSQYANKVASLLSPRGIWLTLVGNADAPPRDSGPPMRSAADIISAIEPSFCLLTLTVSYFGNNQEDPAKIWVALMRRRNN